MESRTQRSSALKLQFLSVIWWDDPENTLCDSVEGRDKVGSDKALNNQNFSSPPRPTTAKSSRCRYLHFCKMRPRKSKDAPIDVRFSPLEELMHLLAWQIAGDRWPACSARPSDRRSIRRLLQAPKQLRHCSLRESPRSCAAHVQNRTHRPHGRRRETRCQVILW